MSDLESLDAGAIFLADLTIRRIVGHEPLEGIGYISPDCQVSLDGGRNEVSVYQFYSSVWGKPR